MQPDPITSDLSNLAIVIPVLNDGESLRKLLHALRPCRQRGAHIVVVDGGSDDNTAAVAESGNCDTFLVSPRGRGQQLHAGAAATDRTLLWFLHADTKWPRRAHVADYAAQIVSALQVGVWVWGRFDIVLSGTDPRLLVIAWWMNNRSRLTGIATGDQGMFVTRDALRLAGGVPQQPLMEDIELSRRLKSLSAPFCSRLTVITDSRRWQAGGVWRTVLAMWSYRARYFFGASPERLAAEYYGR